MRRSNGFRAAGVDIVSAQVQYSLLDRRPEGTLVPWAGANDVHLLCYGTLAGGFLTEILARSGRSGLRLREIVHW